ncbi:Hypothetical protein LUCI_3758 [Lucifera butyrica]|uniref:Uncharacterized protein n=1 Tax=Lucifera butyrica TaxID=1351585 RepID=A0A498REC0_9FIRM|nr:hypothetical protein [Lucifera butyrica]VBB08452.1 Hypothetical protein LUCI_3724 [Lucifera butyrica]VBB08486.1 Hypothetical protein LUCI_3758 [Lucifera butyrica]
MKLCDLVKLYNQKAKRYGINLIMLALAMPLASMISGFSFPYANTISLIIGISGVLLFVFSNEEPKSDK